MLSAHISGLHYSPNTNTFPDLKPNTTQSGPGGLVGQQSDQEYAKLPDGPEPSIKTELVEKEEPTYHKIRKLLLSQMPTAKLLSPFKPLYLILS